MLKVVVIFYVFVCCLCGVCICYVWVGVNSDKCIKVICVCAHTASIVWAIVDILSEAIITLGPKRLGKCLLVGEPTAENHSAILHMYLFSRVETISFLGIVSINHLIPGCSEYKRGWQLIPMYGEFQTNRDTVRYFPGKT